MRLRLLFALAAFALCTTTATAAEVYLDKLEKTLDNW
jgi:hypothetical protein